MIIPNIWKKIQITNQITYRSAAKLPILLGQPSGSQACPLSPSPPTAAGTHLAYGRALKHRWMRLLLVLVWFTFGGMGI
jgi:hypothetical protein